MLDLGCWMLVGGCASRSDPVLTNIQHPASNIRLKPTSASYYSPCPHQGSEDYVFQSHRAVYAYIASVVADGNLLQPLRVLVEGRGVFLPRALVHLHLDVAARFGVDQLQFSRPPRQPILFGP